ncbi:CD209 antigen-like protein A isoform X2 [Mastacembelus armatus]|uniref:CD209 antigen-like protein A isoform X2 n=1 Tax=Mastacembelus armatus TaxID=205130 RepID=UPI000E461453|nr:CD209 antigen-like protein A isoform X2 [Mastacembelus armatus]
MPSNINPKDKVGYNSRVEEDGEWEEREVHIYDNANKIREYRTGFQSQKGDVSVKLENEQLKNRNNLSSSYNQSQNDLKQLQEKIDNMAADNSQLQEEVKKLKDEIEGKWCPEGWTRFGCSCYFKSTQEKMWLDSRVDCFNRGANLVTINSKEEQEFVTKLNMKGQSWIGLWTVEEGSTYTWEWVDISPLSETFWATGHGNSTDWYYGSCCDQQGKWTQNTDGDKTWICEKNITCCH